MVDARSDLLKFISSSGALVYSIERYTGCRIQVLAEDKTYELGEVNDDGVAELRLEGTVDISQALVRIGTRRHRG